MSNMAQGGRYNPAFIPDGGFRDADLEESSKGVGELNGSNNLDHVIHDGRKKIPSFLSGEINQNEEPKNNRVTWGNEIEFLMSCIAMSIGLGNVWRFPFTTFENGGGAFLIPYIIVLFLVGKPFYYLEMIMGQFTSRSSVKMWSCAPAFRGVGWAQMFSMVAVGTYYCSLMSVTLYYLIGSFQSQLPWSTCLLEWGDSCINSGKNFNVSARQTSKNASHTISSAELYYTRTVLKEKLNIDDGVGLPNWKLTICLFVAWFCIFSVLVRGVKSSGKASYFLALFPYVIMIALLIRAVTLKGALNGIIFFIKPQWDKLFDPTVWYAAVTQCFFSLSVCFGGVVMYSSYNEFHHNIYRDVLVVTTLDTFTSLMAGCTIFGILGNLAHELGIEDITKVVKGGTGLAFISYPDAIAKFTVLPQFFSILFFLMLYVLGIGSAIAIVGGIISIISDQFPTLKYSHIVSVTSVFGFLVGTVYCTPGGQFILSLVDYYAGSFIVFILATLEMTGIFWVYGLENFLDDVEFMLKRRPSIYWRLCWALITPLLLATILIYTILSLTPLTYRGILYPTSAYGILAPISVTLIEHLAKMFAEALKPSKNWGPMKATDFASWRSFKNLKKQIRENRTSSKLKQFIYVVLGCEDRLT